jgi:predicted transcriptional regulator
MKTLWNSGAGTVRDVMAALESGQDDQPTQAYTTVMTLMKQLAGKGALAVERDRQPFIYRPLIRRDQVLTERLQQFVQGVFDGQAGELVLRLVEEGGLSADDLRRIEAKIEAAEDREEGMP